MERSRLEKPPEIRRVQPWNVSRQPSHVPRQTGRQIREQALPANPVLWVQAPSTGSTQPVQGFTELSRSVHLPSVYRAAYLSLNHPREEDRTAESLLLLRAAQAVAAASGRSSAAPAWWCLRQVLRGGLVQLSPICKRKRRRKHVVYLVRNIINHLSPLKFLLHLSQSPPGGGDR